MLLDVGMAPARGGGGVCAPRPRPRKLNPPPSLYMIPVVRMLFSLSPFPDSPWVPAGISTLDLQAQNLQKFQISKCKNIKTPLKHSLNKK